MSTINWTDLGLDGPSTFAAAGPPETIVANIKNGAFLDGAATISGGVILGNASGPPLADPVLYGTASTSVIGNASPNLQQSITISFSQPIQNIQVEVFNGNSSSESFALTDNFGDIATITLNPNSATSGNFGVLNLSDAFGATQVTITPVVLDATHLNVLENASSYDYFIDNIVVNYNQADAQIPAQLTSATTSAVYNLATTLSVLALVGMQTGLIDTNTAFLFVQAQVAILDLNALLTDADVEAAATPAPSTAAAAGVPAVGATFDPNYKQPYVPTFVQFSTIQTDSVITAHIAADANAALKDLSLAIGYTQALDVTLNRLNSAIQQNDQASTNLQSAELDTYLGLSSAALAAVGKDFNTLAVDYTGVSLPTLTAQEISSFINNVTAHGLLGLPAQEQTLFNTIGVSSADEQSIVSAISSINPSSVPTSLVSSLQQLATSEQTVAAVYGGTANQTVAFPFANPYDMTEAIYIGYFNRAGDPSGDAYWLGQLSGGSLSVTGVAASFSVQPETTATYPFLANQSAGASETVTSPNGWNLSVPTNIYNFINSVYENVFGRSALADSSSAGLAYWTNQLQSNAGNAQAVASFIINVISGATGADQTTIVNKVTVADYFTTTLATAGLNFTAAADALAHSVIASVTSALSTVMAAESTINAFEATPSTSAAVALVGTSLASAE